MTLNTWKVALCGALAAGMVLLTGCGGTEAPVVTPKPQVTVEYGTAGDLTLDLQEGVGVSYLQPEGFRWDGDRVTYTDSSMEVMTGIDVSEHQRYLDWEKVAADGIDFAMIRLGYRGSTQGLLYGDPFFQNNIEKAYAAGLKVGVYFFSQATTQAEAAAEAYYVTAILEQYRDKITMPVVFDWEVAEGANSRTATHNAKTVSDCGYTFTRIIREAGYDAGVYFNRHMGYYLYDLTRFIDTDVMFWFAGEGEYSDFYYEHAMWQYTFTGRVDGISGDVDMNLLVRPKQ